LLSADDLEQIETDDRAENLDAARTRLVEHRSLVEAAEKELDRSSGRWTETIHAVKASPIYDGLEMRAMVGLTPLGFDPESGLAEFLHVYSHEGPIPERDQHGRIPVKPELGIVLVLIPRGISRFGATSEDPESIHFDPSATANEMRPDSMEKIQRAELRAFFIGKYEITQAQWRRMTGSNPSNYGGDQADPSRWNPEKHRTHPVERVSWDDAQRYLPRFGLVLPTEAQWEYAARAGTRTPRPWPIENDVDIVKFANIRDLEMSQRSNVDEYLTGFVNADDGHAAHAPVGSYLPNRWGLHDVIGNVEEWCLDDAVRYRWPLRYGDGLQMTSARSEKSLRGGRFASVYRDARVSNRGNETADYRHDFIGVRPVMPLDLVPSDGRSDQNEASSWLTLFRQSYSTKLYHAAEFLCMEALRSDPTFAGAYRDRALSRSRIGDPTGSLADWERACKLDPDDAYSHGGRGRQLRSMQRFEDALAALRRAVELEPGNIGNRIDLGRVYDDLGRTEEALATFSSVLERSRKFGARGVTAEILSDRAALHRKMGRINEAELDEKEAEKYRAVRPTPK
jgi:formylglycine-generating enzyme required for sulfatase activity